MATTITLEDLLSQYGSGTVTPEMARQALPQGRESLGFWDWATGNDQYATKAGNVMEWNLFGSDHNVANVGDANTLAGQIGSMQGNSALTPTQYKQLTESTGPSMGEYVGAAGSLANMYFQNKQLGIEGDKLGLAKNQFRKDEQAYTDARQDRADEIARRDTMSKAWKDSLASSGLADLYPVKPIKRA